jgi:sulfate permease, SulP family
MLKSITITLPIVKTARNYQAKWLRKDTVAGVTVAAVAVPQAMAYAQLAGLPLITGLYTALIAMLLFALFTTSRYAIIGPDAAMAALTGATIIPLSTGDPSRYMSLVSVLAILIGVVCLIALFARLGVIAEFISRPILLGYMAGLALAVIASQAPKLFGVDVPTQGNFFTTIWYIVTNLASASFPTILFSSITLVCALFAQQRINKIPMSLIVLFGSIIVSALFSLQDHGIAVVGQIPTGLPLPRFTTVSILEFQNLVIPALMIALVSYANTVATTRAFASKQKESVETPQEFFGLGIANIGSGIFGGMPVAASGSRTAVNLESKAVTQVSQLIGAAVIAIVLLLLSPLLSYLPLAALAVIVILAVKNLFNYKELRSIWHAWQSEAILAIITLLGVTILGIFQGLLLAVLLAVINLVRKNSTPKYAVLGVAADGAVRDMSRPPKTTAIPGLIIFRFDAPLTFINATFFKDTIYSLIDDSEHTVLWFMWDAETITELDSTAAQMLYNLIKDLKNQNITFVIARMKGPIRHTVSSSHRLSRAISHTPHFINMGEAIAAFYTAHPEIPMNTPKTN